MPTLPKLLFLVDRRGKELSLLSSLIVFVSHGNSECCQVLQNVKNY
jgi:hypothetical protein